MKEKNWELLVLNEQVGQIGVAPMVTVLQSPNQKIPDLKTKCIIETYLNTKQNVIFGAK